MRVAVRLFPILLAFAALAIAPYAGRADEAPKPKPPDGGADGADPANPQGPDADKADDKVPFVEEVNRAIDQGVTWLLLRPYGPKQQPVVMKEGGQKGKQKPPFKVPTVGVIPGYDNQKGPERLEGAHWGFIDAPMLYGHAGDGDAYRHPAGPTAFALYALLKCGVDPEHPLVKKGFNWLRSAHHAERVWSDVDMQDRWWCASIAGSSYEVSSMILAVTAKYDMHKRSKNTQAKRKQGKLKITDKTDRLWLEQMVELLVRRRGEPATKPIELSRDQINRIADYSKEVNLPPENPDRRDKDRLGWRYNEPAINLIKASKTSRESMTRGHGLTAPGVNQDLSSTQLAALALFNAHQFGIKPKEWPSVWADIIQMSLDYQEKSGPEHKRFDPLAESGGYAYTPKVDHARGFMYIPGSPEAMEATPSGAMTACGVANLIMGRTLLLEDEDGRKEWEKRGFGKVDPKTKQNLVDTGIWDGLAWLDLNWSSFENRGRNSYHVYYLYALERAMDLFGKNLIGKHLWYTEGARQLLDRQVKAKVKNPLEKGRELESVYWNTNSSHEPCDVLDTCFALLFLKRATKDIIAPPNVTGGDGAPVDNR